MYVARSEHKNLIIKEKNENEKKRVWGIKKFWFTYTSASMYAYIEKTGSRMWSKMGGNLQEKFQINHHQQHNDKSGECVGRKCFYFLIFSCQQNELINVGWNSKFESHEYGELISVALMAFSSFSFSFLDKLIKFE